MSEAETPEAETPEVLDGSEGESLAGAAPLTALKSKREIDAAEIAVLSNFISDVVRPAGGSATPTGAVLEVDLGVDLESEAPAPAAPSAEASNDDVATAQTPKKETNKRAKTSGKTK